MRERFSYFLSVDYRATSNLSTKTHGQHKGADLLVL